MPEVAIESSRVDIRERILIWLAFITLFSLSVGTGPTSIFSVLLLLACFVSGVWLRDKAWWWGQRQWLLPVLLVTLLPWVSLVWTLDPSPRLYPYLQRTHFWLLSITMACLIAPVRARDLAVALISGVQVNVLLFMAAKLGVVLPFPKLYTFAQSGYITYSLLLVLSIILMSFGYRSVTRSRDRMLLAVLMVLNIATVAMLNGRIGYLALVLLSPFIAVNLIGGRRWWLIAMACFALIGILALSPAVQQRIALAGKESMLYGIGSDKARDTSVGIRLALWKGAVSAFAEHPVLGVGIDGYPVIMRRLFPAWNVPMSNPHNYYLYVAATYGLLGLVLYGWLWIVVFKRAWPCRDTWSGFMMLSTLLVVSIGSFTETTPLQPQTGILLAMMVGLPIKDRPLCKS